MSKMLILSLLLAAPLLLAQATWIFLDARKRGENPWLWGLLGLIQAPVPLIVYLIVTRSMGIKCKKCGKAVGKNFKICPYCGEEIR